MFCIHMIVVEFFILVVMLVLYITEEFNHIMAVSFDRRRFLLNVSVFVGGVQKVWDLKVRFRILGHFLLKRTICCLKHLKNMHRAPLNVIIKAHCWNFLVELWLCYVDNIVFLVSDLDPSVWSTLTFIIPRLCTSPHLIVFRKVTLIFYLHNDTDTRLVAAVFPSRTVSTRSRARRSRLRRRFRDFPSPAA